MKVTFNFKTGKCVLCILYRCGFILAELSWWLSGLDQKIVETVDDKNVERKHCMHDASLV